MHNIIPKLRQAKGLTQDELARKAGISRPFLSAIENGAAIPTVAKAAAIAAVLGCTIDELFDRKEA